MDIVLCTDSRYVAPARVTLGSICVNNQSEDICFHIITDANSLDDVQFLSHDASRFSKQCKVYCVPDDICKSMPIEGGNRPIYFSKATYYRLYIASILPLSVSKVLYLDCDILVVDSLAELWATDICDIAVAAVSDMYEGDVSFYNRLQYYPSEGYFNGGVELINLDWWRNHDIERVFADYVAEHVDRVLHHDQDIMNVTLKDMKRLLPLRYNVQDGFLYDDVHLLVWARMDELSAARTNPAIVHFTGRFKPWCLQCNHPWKSEYLRYAKYFKVDMQSFPVIEERQTLYKRLRGILVKLGVIPPTTVFLRTIPVLKTKLNEI